MNLFCTQCGHQNEVDSSFCETCGEPLTSRRVSQEPGSAPARPAARGRWLIVTAAIVLLLAVGVFVAAVLVPSSPALPAMAQLGIGHKSLDQEVIGKWSQVGDPTSGFEFFPDKTFSWNNMEMPLNGTWVVVGDRRIKADVTKVLRRVLLFEDVEISGDKMSGSITVGDKNRERFSFVRVKDSAGPSKLLDWKPALTQDQRPPSPPTAPAKPTTVTEATLIAGPMLQANTAGLGEAKFGMTADAVEKALGRKLLFNKGSKEPQCGVASIDGVSGVSLRFERGRFIVVEITKPTVSTTSGFMVGSSEKAVISKLRNDTTYSRGENRYDESLQEILVGKITAVGNPSSGHMRGRVMKITSKGGVVLQIDLGEASYVTMSEHEGDEC